MLDLSGINIGYALCGSFCTFKRAFEQAEILRNLGAELIPIMSFNASRINTRFGTAIENIQRLEQICQKKIICSIEDAEPIGPQKMADIIAVVPCTGNTLAKLASSITDTPVTMAVKSHIRNLKPVVIAAATNDGLSGSAKNIGALMNMKNYYFVPYSQDDSQNKPTSLIADFSKLPLAISYALDGKQLQPVL